MYVFIYFWLFARCLFFLLVKMESIRRSFNTLISIAKEDPVSLLFPIIFGSIISSASIYTYQLIGRIRIRQQLRKDIKSGQSLSKSPTTINTVPEKRKLNLQNDELAAELIREQLSRNYSFFGEEAMSSIQSAFIIVVGCGGVGSHAAHMLIRSGITRIRIIGTSFFY
jgi:hypothetical protein